MTEEMKHHIDMLEQDLAKQTATIAALTARVKELEADNAREGVTAFGPFPAWHGIFSYTGNPKSSSAPRLGSSEVGLSGGSSTVPPCGVRTGQRKERVGGKARARTKTAA